MGSKNCANWPKKETIIKREMQSNFRVLRIVRRESEAEYKNFFEDLPLQTS